MNEKELKALFWTALNSGHVKNNTVIPGPDVAQLRIVQEANFRSFDLLIASVHSSGGASTQHDNSELLARTRLLTHFAKLERCRADRIQFYPVEVKSDDDKFDERLPNQIIDAILTFGLSILVLDKNHSKQVRTRRLDKVLPATIICYSGVGDQFEVVSVFDRFVSCGIFDFERMNLARLLNQMSGSASSRTYRRLEQLQQILQKIIFSQLHFASPGLSDEEQRFLCALADIDLPNRRKMIAKIIKESVNSKLTDYI
jgi:hypothetical protein